MHVKNNEFIEAKKDEEGIDEMNELTFGNDLCKLSHIPNLCLTFLYLICNCYVFDGWIQLVRRSSCSVPVATLNKSVILTNDHWLNEGSNSV